MFLILENLYLYLPLQSNVNHLSTTLTMGNDQQSKIKETTETSTFPEIYNSLNKLQQKELTGEIMHKLGVSRQAVWYWAKGKKIPQLSGAREIVSNCVKKIVGIKVPQHILFDINN